MNDEVRDQIARAKYLLISPILAEPAREQNAYLRSLADKTHDMPHYGHRRYSVAAFKGWLKRYRQDGYAGLVPSPRADRGRPRRLTDKHLDAIRAVCTAFPRWTMKKLHEHLAHEGLIGDPPVGYATLVRSIKADNLLPTEARCDARKRFEADELNDLWTADFMHGPAVTVGGKTHTAILCAIIDDHTRVIVGWAFAVHETIGALTIVLKDALLAHGVPKRLYVDNGSAFSCELLVKACAGLGISLIHSKPYDAPSRGKIERFFRTVRERFLAGVVAGLSLDELNATFAAWLTADYHEKPHAGIDERPLDRYHASASRVPIRRLSRAELDELFLARIERTVNNDATITIKNRVYEVPAAYIRQRVELRHPIDDPDDLALYDNGIRVMRLKLVDVKENARTFRPQKVAAHLSYAQKAVRP